MPGESISTVNRRKPVGEGIRSLTRRRSGRQPARRIYAPLNPTHYWLIAIGALAVLFLVWWVAAAVNLAEDNFLPSPAETINRGWELAREGTLTADTWVSLKRVMIGFAIATGLALPLGILIGCLRWAEAAIEPSMDLIRYMPVVAFLPLSIIWVGIGETQKYLIIFIGTFFTQVLMYKDNVKRVPREYVDVAYTLGYRDSSILRRVAFPAAAPGMWDTTRITLGWAWTWLVLAELVSANQGLGYRIITGQRYFETDTIFFLVIVIGLIGLVMDQTMKLIGRRLFRWAE